MIYKQAIIQFNKMDKTKREELKSRVLFFARLDNFIVTHFNRNGIMCIKSI